MASPFRQPEWSLEEAALLAHASESVASDGHVSERAIEALSERFRNGAETMGLTISPRYRNVEEVRRNLALMERMIQMVGVMEPDYLEGSVIGRAALLLKNEPAEFHRILDSANTRYPLVVKPATLFDLEPEVEEEVPLTVSEPEGGYPSDRKRRPRIQRGYFGTVSNEPESKSTTAEPPSSTANIEDTKPNIEQENQPVETHKTPPVSGYQRHIGMIKQVLLQSFPKGFRLNSPIDTARFRMAYKSLHGKNMTFKEENLNDFIRNAGFEYEGKVYMIEKVLPSQLSEEIVGFITSSFLTERDYIFYKVLFEKFQDELLCTLIATPEMLREYLKSAFPDRWCYNSNFIGRHTHTSVSIKDEVLNYMLDRHGVVTYEELTRDLDYLPEKKVEHEWAFSDGKLISNGRNEKFHIKSFYITPDQINKISQLITTALLEAPFITGEALLEEVRMHLPELFENNAEVSMLGCRNALACILGSQFAFRNNLISSLENSFDGPSAMVAFCRQKRYFSLEEADKMAEIIGTALNVYLEKIQEQFVRIDDSTFVPKEDVHFDSKAIDAALSLFVKDEYLPITEIKNFEAFPGFGGFAWTERLLESYLLTCSHQFRYLHPQYLSKETLVGAIVSQSSSLKSYEDLLIYALGASTVALEEAAANDYLYNKGLIATRRKNGPVKKLLLKARECRNRLALEKP